ncbi:hypothetical protein [Streptantibioticus cattleyicolor]|uniref:Ig-like domain-containing protein n=1 Tax=Streptantibioticus cattleyicolor (strain ATCC 35852 / DSM 46488 / JCM 4925 / NBRC 14057 / NRRL 8057) TaxID=1003195 RepID=F8JK38_STREN|nr:hypothetical protein [Streptantibioticus cattleyicolor]AEW99827.1 hypothetical protein SCATT_p16340 [Streptantibioticus cattleyicolor NRRL 8057 = DSM 46488]CCB71137.1 exported protein of unknown function [Streptantibioticus cattleyicolor NRRL 8057 = DSM 46488]
MARRHHARKLWRASFAAVAALLAVLAFQLPAQARPSAAAQPNAALAECNGGVDVYTFTPPLTLTLQSTTFSGVGQDPSSCVAPNSFNAAQVKLLSAKGSSPSMSCEASFNVTGTLELGWYDSTGKLVGTSTATLIQFLPSLDPSNVSKVVVLKANITAGLGAGSLLVINYVS